MVNVAIDGSVKQMEMMFVVQPDVHFGNTNTVLLPMNSSDPSVLDAFTLHNAGISDELDNVIRIPFNLTAKGFVIMRETYSDIFRPHSAATEQFIRDLESLSQMLVFDVYIRPSDYARGGLEELCKRLGNTGRVEPRTSTIEMYVEQGSMLVDWDKIMYQNNQQSQRHLSTPSRPSPDFSLSQQPFADLVGGGVLLNTVGHGIATTPNRLEPQPDGASIADAISLSEVESSDLHVDLHDLDKDPSIVEMNVNIPSGEELSANKQPRNLTQQVQPEMLLSKLVKWMVNSRKIREDVFQHRGLVNDLKILRDCGRKSNVRTFNYTLSWCSARLFYDPTDSCEAQLWGDRRRWPLARMTKLINWVNKDHFGAEFSPLLFNHFMELGRLARAFTLDAESDEAEFSHQWGLCISLFLLEFDESGGEGGEGGMAVSRKRSAVDDSGNMSKRARNTSPTV